MLKYIVCCILIVFLAESVISDDFKPAKVIYNVVFDKQVQGMNNELVAFNKHYINMNKLKFNIKDGIVANGVKLYDVTQLIPLETYIWTAPDSVEWADINFGLENMQLVINSLEYNGKTYTNATIAVTGFYLQTHQVTNFARYSCVQKYTDAKVSPVKKAVFNGEQDVTSDFNDIVIPWINQQINTDQFSQLAGSFFDNCDAQSLVNLRKLITEPYSE